jgi:hypothetical protein
MAERHGLRVLDHDGALAWRVREEQREAARLAIIAAAEPLEPGRWNVDQDEHKAGEGDLGVLVLDGFLLRDVRIAETDCAELVGKGDILRPWTHVGLGAPVPSQVEWRVLQRATVAYLDEAFVERAADWPTVIAALAVRGIERAQALAVSLAISCLSGLPNRMLALLWTLADRFGRVGPDGVHLDLPLTHQVLARLAGATRPSVSTALKQLEREGRLARAGHAGYLLYGEPPEELRCLVSAVGETA